MDQDTQIIIVESPDGSTEFYGVEAIMEQEYMGETRQYALMMSVRPNGAGRRGGIVCRYHAEKEDHEALEPIEDSLEMEFLMYRVKSYFEEKGVEMDF